MGLLDFLFGKPKRRRTRRAQRPETRRELNRKARSWIAQDNERRRREKAREERQRVAHFARDARRAASIEKRRRRERDHLRKQGWSETEIDQLERSEDFEMNPTRFDLARALLGGRVRHNPSCEPCNFAQTNPTAREWSERFHGTPEFTQGGKLVLGTLEGLKYKAPAGSKRAGHWIHSAGDTGVPFMGNRGRAKVLADPNTGKLELDTRGSGVRVSPNRGIVG